MPKCLLIVALVCAVGITAVGQESGRVDGVCLFGSDRLKEPLYLFPSDRRALGIFQQWLELSGAQVDFSVRAANVPDVASAESGNQRLLLYNQFILDRFEKADRKDWRVALQIAHQIGHLASHHQFVLEARLRTETEIEADRFAGYLLYRLGAMPNDIKSASKIFLESQRNAVYPNPDTRASAVTEGWHDGKAEEGGGTGFEPGDEENIPKLPSWPPPRASANADVPRDLLIHSQTRPRLMDVAGRLLAALDSAGYAERSFYAVPGGFALVSRIEQIYPDGRPKEGDNRWPVKVEPPRVFSLTSYFRALFTSAPGFYRVIAFIVTNRPLVQVPEAARFQSPRDWVWSGANKVPTTIGFMDYTSEVSCTALIYEFHQVSKGSSAVLQMPGELPGRTHLERSSLMRFLKN
jgi:hypothetical protein